MRHLVQQLNGLPQRDRVQTLSNLPLLKYLETLTVLVRAGNSSILIELASIYKLYLQ